MAPRKTPFEIGNFYHCYSRGIAKCVTFIDDSDCWYFLECVHIFNRKNPIPRSRYRRMTQQQIWELPTEEPLVEIVAYCLMPNHFHFLIKEIEEDGMSTFMQKLMTAYTMRFNKKYARSGGLFTRAFRSKHIADNRYLRQVFSYIHLNPTDLIAEDMKDRDVLSSSENLAVQYKFSSLPDYMDAKHLRPQRVLLTRASWND